MVTGNPPHKTIESDPGGEVRLELARAAAAGEDGVEASDAEVRRDGPSYTYLTLEGMSEDEPGSEVWWLLGADMAASLERWERPERVVELARLAVVPRPGVEMDAVTEALERVGAAGRAAIIDMPVCGVSSTSVRERVGAGRPLRHLVPDPVIELIEERGLYR